MQELHTPVLLDDILDKLVTTTDHPYVDATIGGAGHTYPLLEKYGSLRILGIDADEAAVARAASRLEPFEERVILRKGNFRDLTRILNDASIAAIGGALFDLGISMYQMSGERGFSFQSEDRLDMRMDQDQELTAFDVVNRYSFDRLKEIIETYGEEHRAGRIAHAIVEARKRRPVNTARDLAAVVETVARRRGRLHPATQTFQAVRMEVNGELESLRAGLDAAAQALIPGGRIGVISFHSLEDRIIKETFRYSPLLTVLTKKPIRAGREEVLRNRRSRSAKLRLAEKTRGDA
jgi:16S rRNA (cytosine1402-N4)-methyltransferase